VIITILINFCIKKHRENCTIQLTVNIMFCKLKQNQNSDDRAVANTN